MINCLRGGLDLLYLSQGVLNLQTVATSIWIAPSDHVTGTTQRKGIVSGCELRRDRGGIDITQLSTESLTNERQVEGKKFAQLVVS